MTSTEKNPPHPLSPLSLFREREKLRATPFRPSRLLAPPPPPPSLVAQAVYRLRSSSSSGLELCFLRRRRRRQGPCRRGLLRCQCPLQFAPSRLASRRLLPPLPRRRHRRLRRGPCSRGACTLSPPEKTGGEQQEASMRPSAAAAATDSASCSTLAAAPCLRASGSRETRGRGSCAGRAWCVVIGNDSERENDDEGGRHHI